jgi:hypothetical protein
MKLDRTRVRDILRKSPKQLRVSAGFSLLAAGLIGPVTSAVFLIMGGIAMVGADHPRLQPAVSRLRQCSRRRPIKEAN